MIDNSQHDSEKRVDSPSLVNWDTNQFSKKVDLLIAIVLLLFVFSYLGRVLIRNKNKEIATGKFSGNIQTTFSDPAYLPIYDYVSTISGRYSEDSNFSSSSSEVLKAISKNPSLRKILPNIPFEDIFSLCIMLRSKAKFNEEKSIIEDYFNSQSNVSENELYLYLIYLDDYLATPMLDCAKANQYSKAKWLSNQIIERLEIVDFDPLNCIDSHLLAKYNKIILSSILVQYAKDIFLSKNQTEDLFPVEFGPNKIAISAQIDSLDNSEVLFKDYKIYWRGVLLFRNENFENAITEFNKLNYPEQLPILRDLSNLLIARCHLWKKIKREEQDDSNLLKELDAISKRIVNPTFKSDILFYIEFIKNKGKFPSSMEGSESLNKNDLIDLLIEVLMSKKEEK